MGKRERERAAQGYFPSSENIRISRMQPPSPFTPLPTARPLVNITHFEVWVDQLSARWWSGWGHARAFERRSHCLIARKRREGWLLITRTRFVSCHLCALVSISARSRRQRCRDASMLAWILTYAQQATFAAGEAAVGTGTGTERMAIGDWEFSIIPYLCVRLRKYYNTRFN